jgi:hypothetical protein|tara:strand:+ start:1745 stop:2110 length:366 start_codon:yes stop_codon:yes gene_type:complete
VTKYHVFQKLYHCLNVLFALRPPDGGVSSCDLKASLAISAIPAKETKIPVTSKGSIMAFYFGPVLYLLRYQHIFGDEIIVCLNIAAINCTGDHGSDFGFRFAFALLGFSVVIGAFAAAFNF